MSGKSGFQKVLDKLTHQLPKAANGKDFYPAVIVGGNLGAILGRHLAQQTHGKKEILAVFDSAINEQTPMRHIYEQQRLTKTDYLMSANLGVEPSAATTDMNGVSQYLPEENSIVLTNGEKVKYKQLVIAQGLKTDIDKIEGLEAAWEDFDTPVYTCGDHPSWSVFNFKFTRWAGNFNHGNAYFYIPKFPFKGEIGAYHFFSAHSTWEFYKKIGKVHPNATFTIINANDNFTQFEPDTDEFFKTQLEKKGINVMYNTELTEINKDNRTMTLVDNNGDASVEEFHNLYVIPPCSTHQNLIDAGLATEDSNWKLDVDNVTLRSNVYSNIWGLGDNCDLPITPTFWGGFSQIFSLSQNVYNALKDLPAEIPYEGYTKSVVTLGPNKQTYSIYDYNGPRQGHLLDSNGGPLSVLRYLHYGKFKKKAFMKYYMGKDTTGHVKVMGWKKKLNMLDKIKSKAETNVETEYTPNN